MKECFKDKVVLCTGAAQGIGLATAQEFAKAGAKVILSDVLDMTQQVEELYDTHYKEGKKVTFKNGILKMAGLLFLPDNFDEGVNKGKKYPAIVVTHPGGGVKEQCSSLYAWNMAKNGYVALAFDASHQGESEGEPRYLDDPARRVEDIRCAVDYLITLPYVGEEKIGAMGICAGAGYTMSAIQTEARIKAAAGISIWNAGHSSRHGFPGVHIMDFMQKNLEETAKIRTREARGEGPIYWNYVPETEADINEDTAVILKEAHEYYRTDRCFYPTSVNKILMSSSDKLAAWDAFQYIDTVSPRPLLFIVGSEADTLYFTGDAFARAKEPKEIFTIKGATHIDLYDKPQYVNQAVAKLVEFFGKSIKGE